jgi:hypothetical protein
MNKIILTILIITSLSTHALAEKTYLCQNQNQTALLKTADPKTKIGTYDVCNGGVGDPMTNCKPYTFQYVVQDAVLKIKTKEGYLQSRMELITRGANFEGNDIVLYQGYALQLKVVGSSSSTLLMMTIMATGTPGKPVQVGNYSIPCQLHPQAGFRN